ncbi:MAG: poly(3-hydroxybutyrate) depolymerase [Pseudomonadota bacterium]
MTVQLHIAHSADFVGAGIIAGGPYRAAESFRAAPTVPMSCILNSLYVAMTPLTKSTAPNVDKLVSLVDDTPRIDPTSHLTDQKLYIFTGKSDQVVNQFAVHTTFEFYKALGVPTANIQFVTDVDAGHSIITNNPEDSPLPANQPPYINFGGFFQSHDVLVHIYGKRKPAAERALGELIRFYQADYVGAASDRASFADFGYAYIPSNVKKTGKAIGVHIALHGCKQGYAYVDFVNGRADTQNQPPYGDRYITTTGYMEWAEANDLIVLFPQADGDDNNEVQNPDGCWDWWGYSAEDYSNPDYYTQDAVQIKAIHNMLKQLSGA